MITSILGKKVKQSHKYTVDGERIPVSVIEVNPNVIVGYRIEEKDGYNALRIGIGEKRENSSIKPVIGLAKKAGLDKIPLFFREIKVEKDVIENPEMKVGSFIKVADVLKEGDKISVSGISKGKGFQGGVKRYHFKGGPRTHGQSDRERGPGSIGQTTTPGRVYKGKRMAGRMGSDKVTVKNLKVVSIDSEKNILTVSGLIPGGRNNLVFISKLK